MKKNSVKTFLKSILSAGSKGLVAFGVFGMAAYVYAINFPATQPNPVTGVVGMFAGSTPASYSGNQVGSYENADSFCEAVVEYSHVCSDLEMVNTYNHAPELLNGETESFWVNTGAPGNTTDVKNDCSGWTSSNSTNFGTVWNTSKNAGYLTSCDLTRKFACCK